MASISFTTTDYTLMDEVLSEFHPSKVFDRTGESPRAADLQIEQHHLWAVLAKTLIDVATLRFATSSDFVVWPGEVELPDELCRHNNLDNFYSDETESGLVDNRHAAADYLKIRALSPAELTASAKIERVI